VCVCLCVCAFIHECGCEECRYVNTCICGVVRARVCVFVCACALFTHTHIYTHTHTPPTHQVRYASSAAVRAFLANLDQPTREMFYDKLLPPMCLNRYYVAKGVQLYSQVEWCSSVV
jgi:hypothetical protein